MAREVRYHTLDFEYLDRQTQLARSRMYLEQMRKRRTVSHFSSEPVPFEQVENAIAVAD